MSDLFKQAAERLAEKLKRPPLEAQRGPLMQAATFAVLAASQPETPVKTGTLRRSEATRVEADGDRGYVYSRVLYAPYVHARVPFFDRGMAAARPQIERLLGEAGESYMAGLSQ